MERFAFGIVIPSLNEEKTIGDVVKNVSQYGISIVVDDGSTDKTAQVARDNGAIVVSHPVNMGYDAAINSGFKEARKLNCSYVLTIDADGQHDSKRIIEFQKNLMAGADVVCGLRDKKQRVGEKVFAWIGKLLWKIDDPLCGLKGYKIDLFDSNGHFDSYSSIGTELLLYASKNKKKIVHIPVTTFPRQDKPRFGSVLGSNLKIFRSLVLAFFK